jgi:GNAT superfamily N-acetyltransferase
VNVEIPTWRRGQFEVSSDPNRLDLDVVHGYLTRSYWATGITRDKVERSLAGSLSFGVYQLAAHNAAESQVGFARVVSDHVTFAWLGDVFILEEYQGRGLGKFLMECVVAHPQLQGLRRFVLATRDAHGLYAQFGFEPVPDGRFMWKKGDP